MTLMYVKGKSKKDLRRKFIFNIFTFHVNYDVYFLYSILKRPKEPVESVCVKHSNTWRKFLYNGEILEVGDQNLMVNDIWPMHWTMNLKTVDKETLQFSKNLEELKEYATGFVF